MHPSLIAPLLPEFAQAWCQALYEIRDNEEKDSAFRGLCTLVQTNPGGIAKVRILPVSPMDVAHTEFGPTSLPFLSHNRVCFGSAMLSCDGISLHRS